MKTIRYLWVSLVVVLALCIGVFAWILTYMSQQNENTVNQINAVYLEQMGTQIELQFESEVELLSSRLDSVVWRMSETAGDSGDAHATTSMDALLEELVEEGQDQGFSFLALYDENGAGQILIGEPAQVDDLDTLIEADLAGEHKVASATTASGETMMVVAMKAELPMEGGTSSQVIVAGIPVDEVVATLSLDVSATQVYSHIIRADSTFVTDNSTDAEGDASYFDRIMRSDNTSGASAESTVAALENAMANGETYVVNLYIDGQVRYTRVAPLPYTDWYLVTIVPQSLVSDPVNELINQRTYTTLAGGALILAALLIVFAIYLRIIHRQMAEADAARREANAANNAKSQFLSRMSHDIRTPMNAIVGFSAIASDSIDDRATVGDCLDKITLSSKHLLSIINDVLDMSKIESNNLSLHESPTSITAMTRQLADIIAPQVQAKGQRLDVRIDACMADCIRCDGVRLTQILLNLLSNAVKFTPNGGLIKLEVTQVEDVGAPAGAASVASARAAAGKPSGGKADMGAAGDAATKDTHSHAEVDGSNRVVTRFLVKDSGVGMSEEFQRHVFEPFAREETGRVAQTEGTGLGLSIAKSLIEQMGGTIEVTSAKGVGSAFTVTLASPRGNCAGTGAEEKRQVRETGDAACLTCADDNPARIAETLPLAQGLPAKDSPRESHATKKNPAPGEMHTSGEASNETLGDAPAAVSPDVPAAASPESDAACVYDGNADESGAGGFHATASTEDQPKALEGSLRGHRVLVAEDQELNWEVARALLASTGVVLEWAEDGQACVDAFKASEPGFYDALLMDVQMPVMDGYEATRAIRALDRADASRVPIVAMTADVFSEDVERSLKSGMDAHVSKPIDAKVLAATLLRLIEGPNNGGSVDRA